MQKFVVNTKVHHVSVLSPLLFIYLKHYQKNGTELPWEMLYADDWA